MLTLAAVDHAKDIGNSGLIGHIGSDGSTLLKRITKHSKPVGEFGENIAYGCATGEDCLLQLFIDDGNPQRL